MNSIERYFPLEPLGLKNNAKWSNIDRSGADVSQDEASSDLFGRCGPRRPLWLQVLGPGMAIRLQTQNSRIHDAVPQAIDVGCRQVLRPNYMHTSTGHSRADDSGQILIPRTVTLPGVVATSASYQTKNTTYLSSLMLMGIKAASATSADMPLASPRTP